MRKFRNWVLGGIQHKVFNLVLIVIVLMVAVYTAVILWEAHSLRQIIDGANQRQKEHITASVTEAMNDRLTDNLNQSARMEADIADDMFQDVVGSINMMADYASKLYDNPGNYPARTVALPDPSTDGVTTVQLLTEDGVDLNDPAVQSEIALVGNIGDLLAALHSNTNIDSCYIALPSGIMILADDHASTKFSPDGSIQTIDMTHRPWYTGAADKGGVFFTDVASDVFTGNVGVMCAAPVYSGGKLVAVVGADLLLNDMAASVEKNATDESFTCIISDKGHVIFSPKDVGMFKVSDSLHPIDLRQQRGEIGEFIGKALTDVTIPTVIEDSGHMYYVCGAPVPTVGWAIVNAVDQATTDALTTKLSTNFDKIITATNKDHMATLTRSITTIVVLVLIVAALALAGALLFAKRIVAPLTKMTKRVESLGGEDLLFRMEDEYRTGDEVEALAESFAMLSAKTLQYVEEVKSVTAEKERIGAELSMATDIQASQLPRLFPAFPNRPEFDLYASMDPAKEVGGDFYDFFMVDDDHVAMVIADVSGKGVPAALFMMISRILLKSHLQNGESPAEALSRVNNQLCEGNEAEFFVTVWVAVLDYHTGKGIAANAGHEHPALKHAGGEYSLVVYRHAPALGLMEGIPFREHDFKLNPGDNIFVYTDGVPEATNAENELFGPDRMLDALNENPNADPEQTLAIVRRHVDEFVGEAEQFDDLTMLCFTYKGPQDDQTS